VKNLKKVLNTLQKSNIWPYLLLSFAQHSTFRQTVSAVADSAGQFPFPSYRLVGKVSEMLQKNGMKSMLLKWDVTDCLVFSNILLSPIRLMKIDVSRGRCPIVMETPTLICETWHAFFTRDSLQYTGLSH